MQGYISNEVEAKYMRDIVAKSMGLPKVGVNIGGGRHEDPGITLYYLDVLSHPTNGLWVMHVDDVIKNIPSVQEQFSLLSEEEKDFLTSCLSNLQEITDDWYQFDLPIPT